MDDNELRLEISRELGFDRVRKYQNGRWTGEHDTEEWGLTRDNIPDWTKDIAAAYELEDGLPEAERTSYVENLIRVVRGNRPAVSTWEVTHATPRQRAEAWLMWRRA